MTAVITRRQCKIAMSRPGIPRLLVLAVLWLVAATACGSNASPTPSGEGIATPAAEEEAAGTEEAGEEAARDGFAEQRERMVETAIIGWGIEDEGVIEAMRTVPRHEFVPEQYLAQAYENHPLPIGHGQTISQPYIVALMTEAADIEEGDKVLEVGTGSGYQAAVLAELADQVYTIEIIAPLKERAEAALQEAGYENVSVRHGDGYFGWPEQGPFDAIVVTAAPDHIPQPLVEQLATGAHMLVPVGPVGGYQTLWRVTKQSDGDVRTEDLGGVRFVPLTREDQ